MNPGDMQFTVMFLLANSNAIGLDIPTMEIPVRPGRDMARLTEVAAMSQALKKIGHNSAADFNERLIAHMGK